jgi:hypothetical protein
LRFAPTTEWSTIAVSISAIVLLLALIPISFVMRYQWFMPRPFAGYYGIPLSVVNPEPPYKSYSSLVGSIAPALSRNYVGNAWLPTALPGRLGAAHDFSATVMAGQDSFYIDVMGDLPGLPATIERAFQWNATPNAVPIFTISQREMDRAAATDDVLTMRTAREFRSIAMGTILVDGRIADATYQPAARIVDLRWAQGSWAIRVYGSTSASGDVRRLAVKVARALDRRTLPEGTGFAEFNVDSPVDRGYLSWATSDGLMSAGSQIDPLLAIDVARSMAPMKKINPHAR